MNILLTSSGRRSYMVKYFRQAIGGIGQVHAANSEWSSALQVADRAVISPLIYDSEYINFLLEYCKKNNITAIISLFDIDLPILAKSKNIFKKNGISVVVSDYKVTQVCNDKWLTYKFFTKNKIKTPNTFLLLEEVFEALDKKEISFPIIVKPRWGTGSISVYTAKNKIELEILYKKVKNEILHSYLKYESKIDLKKSVLIQEKINGKEYGLDVINDLNKRHITTLVKKKLAMRSGETDVAITENNLKMRQFGIKIAKKLAHTANLDVDCFLVDKEIYALEMNCRFGGGYPFSHMAGVNLPAAIVCWLKNEKPTDDFFKIKYGIKAVKDINILILNKDE